jgi:PAS domain S-box-containing protein
VLDGAKLLHANQAYLDLVGYTLAELQALPSMLSLVAPEELPKVRQRYLERGVTVPVHERYETVLVAKDGRRIPVMLSSVHLSEAPGLLIMSFAHDLTAAKREAASRHDTEELFRRAFDEAAMGMAIFDAQGAYVRVNHVFCAMVGYAEEELVGASYLKLTFPEDEKPIYDAGHDFVTSRTPTLRFEKRYRHKDGHAVWGHVTSSVMRDEAGKPRLYITQMLDITERKRAEEEARSQLVSRTLVRLLLRDVAEASTNVTRTRELGKRLVTRANEEGPRELGAYLDAFRTLGGGDVRLVEQAGARYTFTGADLLEVVAESAQPTCHLALGYLEGVVGAATGRPALGAEVACRSQGHAACRFVVQSRA